jgi:hypothetical protein
VKPKPAILLCFFEMLLLLRLSSGKMVAGGAARFGVETFRLNS